MSATPTLTTDLRPVVHLDRDAAPDAIVEQLRADGCVVVDRLIPESDLATLSEELAPFIEATDLGRDGFAGPSPQDTLDVEAGRVLFGSAHGENSLMTVKTIKSE